MSCPLKDVMKQQLLDMSSRLQRSAPLLASKEASLSATQQQLERARGEVVAAQAAAAAARQRCEVLRGLNGRLQATVVQQEALLEACLPPGKVGGSWGVVKSFEGWREVMWLGV
jgi:hypothetical protein